MIKETKYKGYFVDTEGNIYSNKSGELKKLKPWLTSKKRYWTFRIGATNILVHRLVAETFIENTYDLPEVNHKDTNTKNNNITNLEWVTHKDNILHGLKYSSPVRNFKTAKVYKDGTLICECKSVAEASRFVCDMYNIPYSMINKHRSYNGIKIVTTDKDTNISFGKRGGYQQVLKGRCKKPSTTTKENPNGIMV
jgi:hypothetical protein